MVHAKLILTQLGAVTSIKDLKKILMNLILTVTVDFIVDVYGYCFYNDSFTANG